MTNIRKLFASGGIRYKPVTVTVDDETSTVYVGKITVAQREAFLKYLDEGAGGIAKGEVYLVQHCTFDDAEGTRAFSDSAEDTAAIFAAPMQFVRAISEEIMRFNQLVGADPVKEAAKN